MRRCNCIDAACEASVSTYCSVPICSHCGAIDRHKTPVMRGRTQRPPRWICAHDATPHVATFQTSDTFQRGCIPQSTFTPDPNRAMQLNLPRRFHCVDVSVACLPGVLPTDTLGLTVSRASEPRWVTCSSSAWGQGVVLCPCMRLLLTTAPSTCTQLGTIDWGI